MRAVASGAIVGLVNENHDQLLGTPEWAAFLHDEVLTAVTCGVDLGDDMLEIGLARVRRPHGCGSASAAWSRWSSPRRLRWILGAVCRDERLRGGGDATELSYPDGSFDSVGTFTMLHHVPTRRLQDAILAEALRVLRPGGTLVGSDSLASDRLHYFHEGDTYNPVEPSSLLTRLQMLGFAEVSVTVGQSLLFWARRGD